LDGAFLFYWCLWSSEHWQSWFEERLGVYMKMGTSFTDRY
jgi:hypothetical protein